jgi:aspartate aminotransferase/aminotransferase
MVKFARRMDKIEVSGIRRMFDLVNGIKNPIDFSLGQPDFDVPESVREAAKRAIDGGNNRYTGTQGMAALQEKVLKHFQKKYKLARKGDKTLITAGATGGLFLASMVLIDEGDEVLIPDPYFVLYGHLVNVCHGKPVFLDTYPTQFRVTPELIEKHITQRTKLLFLNNPVNPTGIAYTRDEIRAICAVAKKHDLMILSDEVYDAFCYDFPFESTLAHCDNALLVGAFSKTYGLPGWRVGYTIGPADIIDKMTMLQQFTYVCASSVGQQAMMHGLDLDPDQWISKSYKKKRDLAYSMLKDAFEVVKPQGAFYIYPKAPGGDAESFVKKALDHKVIIVPGKTCSSRNSHFRLSYAVQDDVLAKGLEILRQLARK